MMLSRTFMRAVLALSMIAAIPAASSPALADAPVKIAIKDFNFQPADVTVKPGTTVIWTNLDDDPHTVTSAKGTALRSNALDTGDSYNMTFKGAGTYEYFCTLHPHMKGVVKVAP